MEPAAARERQRRLRALHDKSSGPSSGQKFVESDGCNYYFSRRRGADEDSTDACDARTHRSRAGLYDTKEIDAHLTPPPTIQVRVLNSLRGTMGGTVLMIAWFAILIFSSVFSLSTRKLSLRKHCFDGMTIYSCSRSC